MAERPLRRNVPAAHAAAHEIVKAGQALRTLVEGDVAGLVAGAQPWSQDGIMAAFATAYRDDCHRLVAAWQRTAADVVAVGAGAAAGAGQLSTDDEVTPAPTASDQGGR